MAAAQAATPCSKALDNLYSIMQSVEGKLGGGEGCIGIYGSITQTGMQRIFESMRHNCGLNHNSVLVDIGAGLGRPLLHALVEQRIKDAFGVELDEVKVSKAEAFLAQSLQGLQRRDLLPSGIKAPEIKCSSIEEVDSLDKATHAYSFWEGVPQEGREAFGRLFAKSQSLKAVTVVQRAVRGEDPAGMMLKLGFGPLILITNFTVKMSGSGRSFQAYVFAKPTASSVAQFAPRHVQKAAAESVAVQEAEQVSTTTAVEAHVAAVLELPQQAVEPPSKAAAGRSKRQTGMRDFAQERKSVVLDAGSSKADGRKGLAGSVSKASGSPSKAEGRAKSSRLAAKAARALSS